MAQEERRLDVKRKKRKKRRKKKTKMMDRRRETGWGTTGSCPSTTKNGNRKYREISISVLKNHKILLFIFLLCEYTIDILIIFLF